MLNQHFNTTVGKPAGGGSVVVANVGQIISHGVALLPICTWLALGATGIAIVVLFSTSHRQTDSLAALALTSEQDTSAYVHVKATARLSPGDKFGLVTPAGEMQPVHMWRREKVSTIWSVHYADQAVITDGNLQYNITGLPGNPCVTLGGTPICNPQLNFIGCFLWGATLIDIEENRIMQHGLQVQRHEWEDKSGVPKITLTVTAPHDPDHPLQTPGQSVGWFDLQNSKRYTIDVTTGRLESACVYRTVDGREVVLFETQSIDYVSEADGEAAIENLLLAAGL